MENIKVIIEMRGGALTAVYANHPLEYVLVDFDNIYQEEIPGLKVMQPDIVKPDLNTIYGVNETGERIAAELKQNNF